MKQMVYALIPREIEELPSRHTLSGITCISPDTRVFNRNLLKAFHTKRSVERSKGNQEYSSEDFFLTKRPVRIEVSEVDLEKLSIQIG